MKPLKWITLTYYIDESTGEILSKHNAENNYIITKKEKHVQKTQYSKWYQKVVGLYNYAGITTITYTCTKNGKQIAIPYY